MGRISGSTSEGELRGRGGGRSQMSRRQFLASAGVGAGALALSGGIAGRVRPRQASGQTLRDASTPGTDTESVAGPFTTSTDTLTNRLNEYWAIYGTATGTPQTQAALAGGALSTLGGNTAWDEWDSLKFRWTSAGGTQSTLMTNWASTNHVNGIGGTTGTQADGYVWSWATLETWPDNNAFHDDQGSYHFDQIPRYVIGIAELALWTRDESFIEAMLPNAEFVMDNYLLGTMNGANSVLTEPSINAAAPSDGTAQGRPGNYMDQVRAGYQDAWVNGAFYTALRSLAEVERLVGQPAKAASYDALAAQFPQRYDAAFWNEATNRYVGWVDKNGALHDAGYTFLNLEAVARGIADQVQAFQVFDFLAAPAQPTDPVGVPPGCDPQTTCTYPPSAHPNSSAVYQLVVAPRANTIEVPLADWDGWSDIAGAGRRPYGATVENGGAFMWEAYYDVLARLRYLGADAAIAKLWTLLARMDADTNRLTFWSSGTGHFFDDWGESVVEIGTNLPFPESGIVPTVVVYGFMGMEATARGLVIAPQLPRSLVELSVSDVTFGGQSLTVAASRGDLVLQRDTAATSVPIATAPVTAAFAPGQAFDEVAILAQSAFSEAAQDPGESTVAATVALDRQVHSAWETIQAVRFEGIVDGDWLPLAVPQQPGGGTYRVRAYDGSGGAGWYSDGSGNLTLRVLNSFQMPAAWRTGPGQAAFAAGTSFDRVAVAGLEPGDRVAVARLVGGQWRVIGKQVIAEVAAGGQAVVAMADQPPGDYQLQGPAQPVTVVSVEWGSYHLTVPEASIDAMVKAGDSHTWPGATS